MLQAAVQAAQVCIHMRVPARLATNVMPGMAEKVLYLSHSCWCHSRPLTLWAKPRSQPRRVLQRPRRLPLQPLEAVVTTLGTVRKEVRALEFCCCCGTSSCFIAGSLLTCHTGQICIATKLGA